MWVSCLPLPRLKIRLVRSKVRAYHLRPLLLSMIYVSLRAKSRIQKQIPCPTIFFLVHANPSFLYCFQMETLKLKQFKNLSKLKIYTVKPHFYTSLENGKRCKLNLSRVAKHSQTSTIILINVTVTIRNIVSLSRIVVGCLHFRQPP